MTIYSGILKILDEIASDTKRSHKISVIEKNKDNQLFKDVLFLALDPYTQFYIRAIPDYNSAPVETLTLQDALNEIKRLASREFTGHAGIKHLADTLSALHPDDAVVIERIIGKDLRCGAADGTTNAAIPGFIATYPCLLARPYDAKNIKNIVWSAISQLKSDGIRSNTFVDGNKVSFCGRSGRPIDLLGELEADFIALGKQFDVPMVFDGEMVVVDDADNLLSRKIGNGIINKAIKGTISVKEAKQVRLILWDAIPLLEFKQGKSTGDYETRFNSLKDGIEKSKGTIEDQLASKLKGQELKYSLIGYKIVNNLEEAIAHFQELHAAGEEGTILKNLKESFWEDTRSKHLVKFKAELECDLEITGYNPGEGKFLGQVGSLICHSSDKLVEVAISGFDDVLRQWITDNITQLMGKIVTVKYNERITSQDKNRAGVDSLFLPRFQEFRNDKLVADSTNEIK